MASCPETLESVPAVKPAHGHNLPLFPEASGRGDARVDREGSPSPGLQTCTRCETLAWSRGLWEADQGTGRSRKAH